MPKISVILNVNNGESYIAQAIESVLNQTCSDFELIIVNDGSIDNTQKIIDEAAARDSRIISLMQQNKGISHAINAGIAISRGDFFAHIDADDVWLENKLERQMDFFEKNPDIGVLCTYYATIETDGAISGMMVPAPLTDRELRDILLYYNPFLHSSLMTRMHLLQEVNGYNEKLQIVIDYDLVVRLSFITKMAILPEVLCYWRKSKKQITATKARRQRWNKLKIKINLALQTGNILKILPSAAIDLAVIILPGWFLNYARKAAGRR